MRFFIYGILAAGVAGPVAAQVAIGTTGACMMEDASGAALNAGSCTRLPADCTSATCEVAFEWMADQYTTVITLPYAGASVHEGMAMNGQQAYAPVALRQSDPRDCIFNAVSGATFCWLPGLEPFTLAVDGLAAWDALMQEARTTASNDGDLLEPLQGKYIPEGLGWDCGEIGRDGGALAIRGDVFYGLETECTLSNGAAVGGHGAVIFDAHCTGEGESWEDEYILRRDGWGSLAWIRSDAVGMLMACE